MPVGVETVCLFFLDCIKRPCFFQCMVNFSGDLADIKIRVFLMIVNGFTINCNGVQKNAMPEGETTVLGGFFSGLRRRRIRRPGDQSGAEKRRSEERRVGKECGS